MGSGVKTAAQWVTTPILICGECLHNINRESDLVDGSLDPHDKRCPECASGVFYCGSCNHVASRLHVSDEHGLTWNCIEGCNP